jgi:hypothetical protein
VIKASVWENRHLPAEAIEYGLARCTTSRSARRVSTAISSTWAGWCTADHGEKTSFLQQQPTGTQPVYVIDPSAKNRSLTDGKSVKTELQQLGIFAIDGNNSVEAGVQQIRLRIQHRKFFIAPSLTGLRGEAEEYRIEDRDDGEFKVVKENDHRLDSGRYVVMRRPWRPSHEETVTPRRGYTHDYEPPYRAEFDDMNSPPMGALS